jgi:hypothetical protein
MQVLQLMMPRLAHEASARIIITKTLQCMVKMNQTVDVKSSVALFNFFEVFLTSRYEQEEPRNPASPKIAFSTNEQRQDCGKRKTARR